MCSAVDVKSVSRQTSRVGQLPPVNLCSFRSSAYSFSLPQNMTPHQLLDLYTPRLFARSAVDAASAQLADTNRDAYGDLPSDPIVVIDGHWCPFSLEDTAKKGHRRYKLRDPYAWESVSDADAFLIPQWLLQAIGGDPVRCTKRDDGRGTLLSNDHVFGLVHASRLALLCRLARLSTCFSKALVLHFFRCKDLPLPAGMGQKACRLCVRQKIVVVFPIPHCNSRGR